MPLMPQGLQRGSAVPLIGLAVQDPPGAMSNDVALMRSDSTQRWRVRVHQLEHMSLEHWSSNTAFDCIRCSPRPGDRGTDTRRKCRRVLPSGKCDDRAPGWLERVEPVIGGRLLMRRKTAQRHRLVLDDGALGCASTLASLDSSIRKGVPCGDLAIVEDASSVQMPVASRGGARLGVMIIDASKGGVWNLGPPKAYA